MALYMRTLPAEARLSRRPGDNTEWSLNTELLAQLVEVVSVFAADRRLKKPVELKRPDSVTPEKAPVGVEAAFAAAKAAGRVRVG